MRILHVNSGNLFGGIETLLVTLARFRNLCDEMDPHFAVCFQGKLSAELSAANVPVHDLGEVRIRQPWNVRRSRLMLRSLLQRESFDIVVCHGAWSLAILGPVARRTATPLILWAHDAPDGRATWLDRWISFVPPDLAICNSRFTADKFHRFYPEVKRTVVYCPIAPLEDSLTRDDRASFREVRNTPVDAAVILQLSRLDPHKGHFLHLEALSHLRDIDNWICWQIAAPQRPHEATYLAALKQTADRFGIQNRIRFLNWEPNISRLLSASDIFCQPNVGPEPFGITFIEALWARLPVIATALGGPIEIIDPSCGILVTPNNSQELADALRKLITDPRLRHALGQSGPVRAAALCSPAQQLRQLYQELLTVLEQQPSVSCQPGGAGHFV
jgi:glycosyltransferase involved in cell wall biosynthesis